MTATRLSQSPLWAWSREFYERAATGAWSTGTVPWRLANSVRVAEAYGRMVTAWRTDLVAAGLKTVDAPVEVLELGGGAGRLSFHLVRWLEAAGVPFQLTFTDAVAANVEAFKARPFVRARAGAVEALTLDVLRDAVGPPLAPEVVIASYLFDTLPHDAWAMRGGRLVERRVTVELPPGEGPPCERARLHFTDAEAAPEPFVRGYAPRVGEGAFLVPTGALECLKRASGWAGGRCLVLAADKGEPDVEAVRAGEGPRLQRHGGVSAMVNFDAVRAWWGWRPFLRSAHAEPDLGFYALAQGLSPLAATRATWSATLGAESLLHRHKALDALLAQPQPVEALLAALEAWSFDPDVLVRMAEPLRGAKPTAQECERLVAAIDRAWEHHFEVGGALDVAFELATVLHRVGQLTHASRFYQRSLEAHGRHATVCFNLGLCRLDLGDAQAGAALMREVLALSPSHEGAARVLAQL